MRNFFSSWSVIEMADVHCRDRAGANNTAGCDGVGVGERALPVFCKEVICATRRATAASNSAILHDHDQVNIAGPLGYELYTTSARYTFADDRTFEVVLRVYVQTPAPVMSAPPVAMTRITSAPLLTWETTVVGIVSDQSMFSISICISLNCKSNRRKTKENKGKVITAGFPFEVNATFSFK